MDSQSLVDKLHKILEWTYYYPNSTMDPDWDVIQSIITALCLFPCHISNTSTVTKMSTPHITHCLLMPKMPMHISEVDATIIPLIKSSQAQLRLPEGTVMLYFHRAIVASNHFSDTILTFDFRMGAIILHISRYPTLGTV